MFILKENRTPRAPNSNSEISAETTIYTLSVIIKISFIAQTTVVCSTNFQQ